MSNTNQSWLLGVQESVTGEKQAEKDKETYYIQATAGKLKL